MLGVYIIANSVPNMWRTKNSAAASPESSDHCLCKTSNYIPSINPKNDATCAVLHQGHSVIQQGIDRSSPRCFSSYELAGAVSAEFSMRNMAVKSTPAYQAYRVSHNP